MNTKSSLPPRAGDWLVASGLPGHPTRRGQILEILGEADHMHYRVRWDEEHESLFYPADGAAHVIHPEATGHPPRESA